MDFEWVVAGFGAYLSIPASEEENYFRLSRPPRPQNPWNLPNFRKIPVINRTIHVGKKDASPGVRMVPADRLQAAQFRIRLGFLDQCLQSRLIVLREKKTWTLRVLARERTQIEKPNAISIS